MSEPTCGRVAGFDTGFPGVVCVRPRGHSLFHADTNEDIRTSSGGNFWVETTPVVKLPSPPRPRFYVLCFNHVDGSNLLFWKRGSTTFTERLDEAGIYTEDEAKHLHMPLDGHVMVPTQVIDRIVFRAVHRDNEVQLLREFGGLDHEQIRRFLMRCPR